MGSPEENKQKNLTAEFAEHAEAEMAKSLKPGCRAKSDVLSLSFRKVKKAPGGFPGTISALTASSPFILWSSFPEGRKAKRNPYS